MQHDVSFVFVALFTALSSTLCFYALLCRFLAPIQARSSFPLISPRLYCMICIKRVSYNLYVVEARFSHREQPLPNARKLLEFMPCSHFSVYSSVLSLLPSCTINQVHCNNLYIPYSLYLSRTSSSLSVPLLIRCHRIALFQLNFCLRCTLLQLFSTLHSIKVSYCRHQFIRILRLI